MADFLNIFLDTFLKESQVKFLIFSLIILSKEFLDKNLKESTEEKFLEVSLDDIFFIKFRENFHENWMNFLRDPIRIFKRNPWDGWKDF